MNRPRQLRKMFQRVVSDLTFFDFQAYTATKAL